LTIGFLEFFAELFAAMVFFLIPLVFSDDLVANLDLNGLFFFAEERCENIKKKEKFDQN
jgi:hypothetical protein